MKVAQHPKNQQPVTASHTAPDKAIYPHCGGVVTLRRRKCMGGECVYFWRHLQRHAASIHPLAHCG